MNTHARIPALIACAIILSGGFGIVRMTFVPHDPIGLSAIMVALVLGGFYKRFAASTHLYMGRVIGSPQSKPAIQLASEARASFEVFPGRPEGYAGYADSTMMSVVINDDLAARQPTEQYALLGFGTGFLTGIWSRLADCKDDDRAHFHVIDASQECKETIGWLAFLQRWGTDGGTQSTENLYSEIRSISAGIGSKGPITMQFWDKVHNKRSESLDASGTSPEMLAEWMSIYQAALVEGQRQAVGAGIVAKPI